MRQFCKYLWIKPEKATHLVDSVANSICKQIMSGRLEVDDEESSLHLDVAHKHE